MLTSSNQLQSLPPGANQGFCTLNPKPSISSDNSTRLLEPIVYSRMVGDFLNYAGCDINSDHCFGFSVAQWRKHKQQLERWFSDRSTCCISTKTWVQMPSTPNKNIGMMICIPNLSVREAKTGKVLKAHCLPSWDTGWAPRSVKDTVSQNQGEGESKKDIQHQPLACTHTCSTHSSTCTHS